MIRKYLKFALLFFLAVAILWYFGRGLNWEEVGASLGTANKGLLALAAVVICLGYVLRALRWGTLLKPLATSDFARLFETTTVGFAAVLLFGRIGEVVRPLWLPVRDDRVRPTAALVSIGVERICDLTAIVLLFSLNLIWFEVPPGREGEFAYVNRAGVVLLVSTILGIVGLAIYQRFSKPLIDSIDRNVFRKLIGGSRVRLQLLKLFDYLSTCLGILSDPREFILVAFWTGLLWFSISIPTWLVLNAFGLPLDFSDALFVMGWAVVGSLVPTPGGGAGAFHTATAGALIFIGIEPEPAAAVAIVMHLIYFAPALAFGVYYFLRGDITLASFRSMIMQEKAMPKENNPIAGTPYGTNLADGASG